MVSPGSFEILVLALTSTVRYRRFALVQNGRRRMKLPCMVTRQENRQAGSE